MGFFRDEPILNNRSGEYGMFLNKRPRRTVPVAFHLSGYFSRHFGHWIGEYLPKLRHLERHPKSATIPILVNDDMPASHYDALALLTGNEIIRMARDETICVSQLYVAPTINFMAPDYHPGHPIPVERQAIWSLEAMEFMRSRILRNLDQQTCGQKRIFLSRRNSTWARPTNEDDVERFFMSKGFEIIQPEKMGFKEQVQTMACASQIAGPSGSAFNLAIFAPVASPIIIMMQGNPHNWGGWLGPMQQLGFEVRCVLSDVESRGDKLLSYSVDLDRLASVLP